MVTDAEFEVVLFAVIEHCAEGERCDGCPLFVEWNDETCAKALLAVAREPGGYELSDGKVRIAGEEGEGMETGKDTYERIARDATLPTCAYHAKNRTPYREARCAGGCKGRRELCWTAMQSDIKERFDGLEAR